MSAIESNRRPFSVNFNLGKSPLGQDHGSTVAVEVQLFQILHSNHESITMNVQGHCHGARPTIFLSTAQASFFGCSRASDEAHQGSRNGSQFRLVVEIRGGQHR